MLAATRRRPSLSPAISANCLAASTGWYSGSSIIAGFTSIRCVTATTNVAIVTVSRHGSSNVKNGAGNCESTVEQTCSEKPRWSNPSSSIACT